VTTKPVISLRQRALDYLSRREHSRQELARKLAGFIEEGDDTGEEQIAVVLDDFQRRGWLSDERFAEQVVHARSGRYGSLRVAHELREKGVNETLAEKAVSELADADFTNARAICRRKYGEPPKNREEWAKQARFLQNRGFGFDVIKHVLNEKPNEKLNESPDETND
jgi:regulatory protein